mgnify:CR=1 FL=1
MKLPRLNFPDYNFTLNADNSEGEGAKIFDIIRKKFVQLSPEEWVRQHALHYLVKDRGFPPSLIAVEKTVKINRMDKRFDILAYTASASPLLLGECKSPYVNIDQKVFDQASRYNIVLNAPYFLITNGLVTVWAKVNRENMAFEYLESIPRYEDL